MAENSLVLTGTLGSDPEVRATTKGDVTSFSLAHAPRIRDDQGNWTDGETSWFEVSVWGTLGKHVLASFKKGQRALVHGSVSVNEWSGNDGVKRRKVQIKATSIGHDLAFGTTTFAKVGQRPVLTAVAQDRTEPPATATEPERAPEPVLDWSPSFSGDEVATPF